MATTYTRIILTADDILTWAKEKGLIPSDGEHKVYATNGEGPNSVVDDLCLMDTDTNGTSAGNFVVITNES